MQYKSEESSFRIKTYFHQQHFTFYILFNHSQISNNYRPNILTTLELHFHPIRPILKSHIFITFSLISHSYTYNLSTNRNQHWIRLHSAIFPVSNVFFRPTFNRASPACRVKKAIKDDKVKWITRRVGNTPRDTLTQHRRG